MADSDFIAFAAAGESGGRLDRQSFSGFDADSGANIDVRAEDYRDDSGYYDNRRMDDGHAARIRDPRVRHDASGQRRQIVD